jgi:outer membrane protein assembly factor BamB
LYAEPVAVGDVLYFGDGTGAVHALSAKQGHGLWSYAAGSAIVALAVDSGLLYAVTSAGRLLALQT